MSRRKNRKLALKKETLRKLDGLSPDELQAVNGGSPGTLWDLREQRAGQAPQQTTYCTTNN